MALGHVALLRGINVGGKNMLPMPRLAEYFTDAGCTGVKTYIQSGNVVFSAGKRVIAGLPECITERIESEFGHKVPVVLRSAAEISEAISNNPFFKPGADEKAHFLMFLADTPTPEAALSLDPQRSPGDEFHLRGKDLYVYLRTGAAKTKLTNAWFDRRLSTVSTSRNWRTVLKIHELLSGD